MNSVGLFGDNREAVPYSSIFYDCNAQSCRYSTVQYCIIQIRHTVRSERREIKLEASNEIGAFVSAIHTHIMG